jgi:hypothetical protein
MSNFIELTEADGRRLWVASDDIGAYGEAPGTRGKAWIILRGGRERIYVDEDTDYLKSKIQ